MDPGPTAASSAREVVPLAVGELMLQVHAAAPPPARRQRCCKPGRLSSPRLPRRELGFPEVHGDPSEDIAEACTPCFRLKPDKALPPLRKFQSPSGHSAAQPSTKQRTWIPVQSESLAAASSSAARELCHPGLCPPPLSGQDLHTQALHQTDSKEIPMGFADTADCRIPGLV